MIFIRTIFALLLALPFSAAAQPYTTNPSTAQEVPQNKSQQQAKPQKQNDAIPTNFIDPADQFKPTITCPSGGGNCDVTPSAVDGVRSKTFVPLVPIPGLTEGVVADSQGLANFLNNLYKYLIGVAAVLAVIMIIWGGLEIATQDSVSKQGAGRKKIQEALYGLVLVLSPALVFGIINPSILDLNFAKSLKPLDIHNTKVQKDTAQQSSLGTALANKQQFLPCSDATSCDEEKNSCEAKGGSGSIQCYDPNNGKFYDPSFLSKVIESGTYGIFGSTATCASSDQSLGVVCTGATSVSDGVGATTGDLYNSPYATLARFSSQSSAQAFKCTNSNQQGPSIFSGPAATPNSTYTYAMCIRISYPYVNVYTSGIARGPDPDTRAGETAYVQSCQDLISTLKQQGFHSSLPTERENMNPTQTTCSDLAIKKYGGDAKCYKVTATCSGQ